MGKQRSRATRDRWRALQDAFEGLRKDASAGVDGKTHAEYAVAVRENLTTLHDRLTQGKYRAEPLRRIYIPKEDGRQRPISIPSLEDKIVQKAAADLLNATGSSVAIISITDVRRTSAVCWSFSSASGVSGRNGSIGELAETL